MTFRLRLAIATALAVAGTVAVASGVVYVVMRSELRQSLDQQLAQQWTQVHENPGLLHAFDVRDFPQFQIPRGGPRTTSMYMQLVTANGQTALTRYESKSVPVSDETVAVAAGTHPAFYEDAIVGGVPSRVYTVQATDGFALQFVRPVEDVERALSHLRLILLLVVGGGLAAGAAAGALVSGAALVPVRRLTGAAEHVAETRDPSERVPEGGRDELARLGSAFNTMLAALEESIETQRRFVADASHELRTPLTSLQTNIDVLRQEAQLDPVARQKLLADLQRETHEMRDLISGLLELARGEDPRLERTTVQLDELVESCVDRARTRFPKLSWEATIVPSTVEGHPERLERAVWNLLENAGKWSDEGGTVEVALTDHEVVVRDHGPGIAPEDRPLVFDRFYRATSARSMPGSGLGLAIVREVAEAHGGTVTAEEAPGGGALMRLHLDDGAPATNGREA